jgi:hypothetical protein
MRAIGANINIKSRMGLPRADMLSVHPFQTESPDCVNNGSIKNTASTKLLPLWTHKRALVVGCGAAGSIIPGTCGFPITVTKIPTLGASNPF